jgi:hypothetical protein
LRTILENAVLHKMSQDKLVYSSTGRMLIGEQLETSFGRLDRGLG